MTAAGASPRVSVDKASEKVKEFASDQRGKRIVIGVASAVAVVLLGLGLLRTDVFSIESIDVTGNQRIDRNAVVSKAGLRLAMPMISVDESNVEARLEKDPWVETASVSTDWPRQVSIEITERRPLLMAQTTDNKWAEIGAGGVVLAVSPQPPLGLPLALDAKVEPRPGAVLDPNVSPLVTAAAAMPESLKPQVSQMKQDESGIRLGLISGLVVLVGSPDQIGEKLTAAATVVRNIDPKTVETLDVTSPAMPVSTPKEIISPPTTVAQPKVSTTEKPQSSTNKKSQPQQSIDG